MLIAASTLVVFAMMHHPTANGHTLEEFADHVHYEQALNQWVHGGAIALMVVMLCAFGWLFSRLGSRRLINRLALICFSAGTAAMTAAALVSGYITPFFLARVSQPSESEAKAIQFILGALRDGNRAFDELGVVTISVAVGCWSICLLSTKSRNWICAGLGGMTATAGLIGLLNGSTGATVHGIQLFAILLAVWSVACGVMLIRGRVAQE